MNKIKGWIAILLFSLLILSGASWGDVIYLKDGSVIKGEVVKEDGEIQIRTSYGVLSIKRDEVDKIIQEENYSWLRNIYRRIVRANEVRNYGGMIGVAGALVEWIGISNDSPEMVVGGVTMALIGIVIGVIGEIQLDQAIKDLRDELVDRGIIKK